MKKFSDGMRLSLSELTYYDSRTLGINPNMENIVKEWFLITRMSNDITSKLNDGSYSQEDINSVFYTLKHFYFLNPFSIENIEARNIFYQKVLEAFKVDPEDAFSKIQLSWLGITGGRAQKIIEDSKLSEIERLRIKICVYIDAALEKEMSEKENSKWKEGIKKDIRKYMEYMVPEEKRIGKWKSVDKELNKTKRPITSGQMDYLREECGLPYAIKNHKLDGVYRYVFVKITDSIES